MLNCNFPDDHKHYRWVETTIMLAMDTDCLICKGSVDFSTYLAFSASSSSVLPATSTSTFESVIQEVAKKEKTVETTGRRRKAQNIQKYANKIVIQLHVSILR